MSFVIALVVAALIQAAPPAAPFQVTTSGQSKVGYFEAHEDVGNPAIAGTTVYDAKAQTYTITGAGVNMWGTRDEFQFAADGLLGFIFVEPESRFGRALT